MEHIIAKNFLGMENYRDPYLIFYHEVRQHGASYKLSTPNFFSECVEQVRGNDVALSFDNFDEIVCRHINWNTHGPDLKEDLAHLVDNVKRRICGIASAGFP
jgi:hypothetical protein